MRAPLLRLHGDELIVDNFAGGGGASLGIEWALGRSPDIAINHDPEAIAMHAQNHPATRHYCENVWDVDPIEACGGRPVGLAWFSPDCKHFSKAKGGKPVERAIRGLAWVVIKWARLVRPRVILLENVEEFQTWGPLGDDNRPCPLRKGLTFRRWCAQLESLGYAIEMRELRACDYGAPTIRKRLFVVARCDGAPIVWPEPTHGPGRQPYRTAAECIEWSLGCRSIFMRDRPLAEATLRRIAKGIQKYVVAAAPPFLIPLTHQGDCPRRHALVAGLMAQHNGGYCTSPARPLDTPISTITQSGAQQQLVTSHLVKLYGSCAHGQGVEDPLPTVTAGGQHVGEVRAFLLKYYGTDQDPRLGEPLHTVTTKHRFGLVTVAGQPYAIADIGMRMLAPRELYRGQGFPDTYSIDVEVSGKPLSKTAQVRMCGNSVAPPIARAIVAAQFAAMEREAAA